MPNIIELNLLSNKSIVATMQGYPLANENSYKIVAGDENATQFTIKSKPTDYENATYFVEMVNAKGYKVKTTQNSEEREEIKADSFTLPVGMAVEGYGYISISCECDITSTTIKGAVITTDYTKISERGKAYVFTYEKGWQLKVEDTIYKNVSLSTYGIAITNDVEINLKEGDKIIVTTRAKPVFQPLKIKVWNTLPNWKEEISEGGGGVGQELLDQVNANTQEIGHLQSDSQRQEQSIIVNSDNIHLLEEKANAILANTDGILDEAVFKGVTNNSINLSSEEKTSALEWLGAIERPADTSGMGAYIKNNAGNTALLKFSEAPNKGTLAYRDSNGNFQVNAPVKETDCANKQFVIETFTGFNQQNAKMYRHNIILAVLQDFPWGEVHFSLVTSDPTPYTIQSIITEKVFKLLHGTSFSCYSINEFGTGDYGAIAWEHAKTGTFYHNENDQYVGFFDSVIFIGMLFGNGSKGTLEIDDRHSKTVVDEVIEL